jgi:uncharacterized OB-fold protein
MTTNYIVSGWIHPLPDGRLQLVAQHCRECGANAFPRTPRCKRCASDRLEQVMLGPEATLYSVTTDRVSSSPDRHKLVGQAQFEQGAFVQGYVVGDPNKPPAIGTVVELAPYDLPGRDGEALTTYSFRPKER